MLTKSYIKPKYDFVTLILHSNKLSANPFTQKIFQKKHYEYTEQYPTAINLVPSYNYSNQFMALFNHDAIFIIGLLLLFFLAFIKVQFPQVLKRLIASVVNFQYAKQIVNEKSGIIQKSSWFLLGLFIISFSFFLTAVIYYFNPGSIQNKFMFLNVLCFVTLFYLLKFLLYFIIGYLTDTIDQTKLVMTHFYVFYRNLSIFLTPLSTVLFFIHIKWILIIMSIMILLFVVLSIMRIYRAIFLSLQWKFSYLFIFLYLCTIEIIPLLYGYKILIMWV